MRLSWAMARRVRRIAIPVVCALLGACGLDFGRFDPAAGSRDGGAEASVDAGAGDAAPADAATTDAAPADGSPIDVATGHDAAPEAASNACTPTPAGTMVAARASGPVTVDGDLGDWGSPTFQLLDATNAALIVGPNGTCNAANATPKCLVPSGESAEVALLADAANLYVGVRVTVAGVGGTNTTTPYLNDAVEIYLRGDPAATGDYTGLDHQLVVDWQNLVLDYGPSPNDTPLANPPGVKTAVKVGNGGYVVEASIALAQLGRTALAPGQTLGFDLGVDHGQGTTATRSLIVWWSASHAPPHCTTPKCTGCNPDQPYCDTLDFGLVCAE